ncbi:hypothetical protein [Alteribacillus iranensis]|uniref:DoxX-like family protein n=1 Tax=Alteribacillus iranensis TaxID=930128 RepID=A0A1I2F1P3_9BACI|nr:hypothetical protein [Alteribacillus iranensis]SFE99314.1 hypothetical protein SAMN05192532_10859 [Alteribacillus iranensis]
MGTVTATGAILFLTGWFALVEFDSFPESERKQILQKIKSSPAYILLIAFMPIGVLLNVLGAMVGSVSMIMIGAFLIILQGIMVSLLFWRRKRWKSILLLTAIVLLGIFVFIPYFLPS